MKDVFISYSSKDKVTADAVCARLEAQNIRCWIAPRDVLPSDLYGEAIIRAIHGSRLMVLVFSAHSNESPQVMREVERAVSQGLAILPFRIEAVPLSPNMEYFISAPHWLDAMTQPLDEHLERLAATVKLILSQDAPAPEATTPSVPVARPASAPVPVPLSAKPNRLPMMLAGAALLLVFGGVWGLSRTHHRGTDDQRLSERTNATTPALAPTSAPAGQQAGESSTTATSDATMQSPVDSKANGDHAEKNLLGQVGDTLSDGRWRFQLLDVQPVKSYALQKTTEADYALYHATADFANNTFTPQIGYHLFILHGRVVNAMKEKQAFWHYNNNTAVLDAQGESYPPIAFDMRGGMIQSEPLLPDSKLDFAVIFALPQDSQPKELVFTLQTISDKAGTDVHVQLR